MSHEVLNLCITPDVGRYRNSVTTVATNGRCPSFKIRVVPCGENNLCSASCCFLCRRKTDAAGRSSNHDHLLIYAFFHDLYLAVFYAATTPPIRAVRRSHMPTSSEP